MGFFNRITMSMEWTDQWIYETADPTNFVPVENEVRNKKANGIPFLLAQW